MTPLFSLGLRHPEDLSKGGKGEIEYHIVHVDYEDICVCVNIEIV
jgi:hypothetical protein